MKYYIISLIIVCIYLFIRYHVSSMFEGFAGVAGASVAGASVAGASVVGASVAGASVVGSNLEKITGDSFCSLFSSKPQELNNKCNTLTEKNCNATSCCLWLNGTSCVAGNAGGPTFRTKGGKDIDVKYYSYKHNLVGKN